MPSISVPAAIGISAGVGAVGSVAGGLISASGAKSAASQQAAAAEQAAQLQNQQYQQTRADLLPYNTAGQSMLGPLSNYYGTTAAQGAVAQAAAQGAIPQIPDQATLLNMPGYQFNLDQGLKAIQSQATANGLGLSGAATKAAMNYGTGLADQYLNQYFNMGQTQYTDYAQQFQNQLALNNAVFGQLYDPARLGEAAAAQTGTTGASLAQSQGNALMAAGQAQAAGTGAAAGALSGGLQNAGNSIGNSLMTYALLGRGAPVTGAQGGGYGLG